MSEHEEHQGILKGFKNFVEAREVFDKYKGKWFSGNDNHVGDIGEYWAMRYFKSIGKEPKLAPSRISPYDIKLNGGTILSVKTRSKWNKSKQGGLVKGIEPKHWDFIIAVDLDKNLGVESFYIIPHEEVRKRIGNKGRFPWKDVAWLEKFREKYRLH
jgi:hypothetical protein